MFKVKRSTPRPIHFEKNINPYVHGSVIVCFGNTKVHITATVEENVPPFLKDKKQGWVTAEYSMLPGATNTRNKRDRNSISGRSQEIQRLIGRSLRSIVDLKALGERSITIDCDVLLADGGTRTASITGGYVALNLAIQKLIKEGKLEKSPIKEPVAAISVGINRENEIVADLNYDEDSNCKTDMNIVMTSSGKFVEIQGTAEDGAFSREENNLMLDCAWNAIQEIFEKQRQVLL
jgi:ribonuclease PH